MDLENALRILSEKEGSDLYFSTGAPISAKFHGTMTHLDDVIMKPGDVATMANGIMDEDMEQIARFSKLEVLALADTQVTGASLGKLTDMSRLNELNLTNCVVRDHDLSHFLSMPNLRIVYAEGCNLSDYAVGGIIARFPTLAIFQ